MRPVLGNTGLAALALFSLSGLVSSTLDICSAADITTNNCVCPTSSKFRALRRRGEECTIGDPCCTQYANVLSEEITKTENRCGKKGARTSEVKVQVATCVDAPTEKCLHVTYENVATQTYQEVHLELSKDPIKQSAPGLFHFNSYCSLKEGGAYAECWVPLNDILKQVYGDDSGNILHLCDATNLYIAAHTTISDGNTCWGVGSPIDETAKNWAMYFQFDWSCSNKCVHSCCCPEHHDTHSCEFGTAFGVNPDFSPNNPSGCSFGKANLNTGKFPCKWTLNELGCGRWGWYAAVSSGTIDNYHQVLHVGAGQNDVNNGVDVGAVSLHEVATGIEVKYTITPGTLYEIDVPHVYISCDPVPSVQTGPGGNHVACSPGQYTISPECLTGGARKEWTTVWEHKCTGTYYLIFHAAISKTEPTSTTCTEATCVGDLEPEFP